MEQKTYMKELGISRTDKWAVEGVEEAGRFLLQKGEIFQSMCFNFIKEHNPELIPLLVAVPPLSSALVNLLKLIYSVGYIKGLSDGEDRAARDEGLKKLWEG